MRSTRLHAPDANVTNAKTKTRNVFNPHVQWGIVIYAMKNLFLPDHPVVKALVVVPPLKSRKSVLGD
jgi:hypothetical protein